MTADRQLKKVLSAVPNNWLDPLLTGPHAVIGEPPYGDPDIERLMNAVRERVRKETKALLERQAKALKRRGPKR